ncbi:MAG: hypothetical protein AAF591_22510, partial [Verrucomicrobiota bacterium]
SGVGILLGVAAGLGWAGVLRFPGPVYVTDAVLTVVAILLVLGGLVVGRFGRGAALGYARRRLESGREVFEEEMGAAFEEGVDRYFDHFGKLEEQVRELSRVQDELYGPQVAALEEIEGSFRELEELLGEKRER